MSAKDSLNRDTDRLSVVPVGGLAGSAIVIQAAKLKLNVRLLTL